MATLAAGVLWTVPTACHRSAAQKPAASAGQPRVISLSPAISKTMVDFGLQNLIVGRTPHCASLDQSIPVVGDLMNFDYEQAIRLRPTHMLVQAPESGVDPHLTEVAREQGGKVSAWRLTSLEDIETMVRDLPGALFQPTSAEFSDASRKAAAFMNDMAEALSPGSKPMFRGPVMMLYSVAPVSVFGKNTYLDGILTALGGTNATEARDWVTFSLEDVVRINPQAIIVVKPGAKPENVSSAIGSVWDLDIAAVTERRLAILTHPDAFMPCTGVVGVARELRKILESFEAEQP